MWLEQLEGISSAVRQPQPQHHERDVVIRDHSRKAEESGSGIIDSSPVVRGRSSKAEESNGGGFDSSRSLGGEEA